MVAIEIKKAYYKACLDVPKWLNDPFQVEDYDDYESWCCGIAVYMIKRETILICEYCAKGRGSDKSWILKSKEKEIVLRTVEADNSSVDPDVRYLEKQNLLLVNGIPFELNKIDI